MLLEQASRAPRDVPNSTGRRRSRNPVQARDRGHDFDATHRSPLQYRGRNPGCTEMYRVTMNSHKASQGGPAALRRVTVLGVDRGDRCVCRRSDEIHRSTRDTWAAATVVHSVGHLTVRAGVGVLEPDLRRPTQIQSEHPAYLALHDEHGVATVRARSWPPVVRRRHASYRSLSARPTSPCSRCLDQVAAIAFSGTDPGIDA